MKKFILLLILLTGLMNGCAFIGDDPIAPPVFKPGTLMDGPELCSYFATKFVDETYGLDDPGACGFWELTYQAFVFQFLEDEEYLNYYVILQELSGEDVPDVNPYLETPCDKYVADQAAEDVLNESGE